MATQYAFGKIVTNGLVLALDAADRNSYPGSGTTWRDLSANNNNNTLINSPTFNSANGGSIVFDGVDDHTTASDNTSLRPTSFSIDTWIRPTSFSSFNTVVVKPFNGPPWSSPFLSYMVRIETSGTILSCGTNTAGTYRTLSTSYTFSTNTTYNVSFTFNSSTGAAIAYVNGSVLSSTTHTAGAISYAALPVLIGASYGTSPVGEFFAGSIYSVKIYNTILSSTEILQNYNAQKSRFNL
jgi:hypothetical protein